MTPKQVRSKLAKLHAKEKKISEDILDLRAQCSHKTLFYKPEGDSGGWDYVSSYWYSWRCYDCGQRWTTPQELRFTEQYPHAIKVYKYNRDSAGPTEFPDSVKTAEWWCR